jgi:hypothetical protein
VRNNFVVHQQPGDRAPSPALEGEIDKNLVSYYINKDNIDLHNSDHLCAICMADYGINDKVSRMPCNHIYHDICLRQWLSTRHANCPYCRAIIPQDPVLRNQQNQASAHGGKKSKKTLEKCTVAELKERAAKRKINVTGLKKNDIIAKLRGKQRKAERVISA